MSGAVPDDLVPSRAVGHEVEHAQAVDDHEVAADRLARAPHDLLERRGIARPSDAPQQVLVFATGRLIKATPTLPEWVLTAYAADLVI